MNEDIFNIRQLLNVEACTRCGKCTDACSAYNSSMDIGLSPPKKIELLKKKLFSRTFIGRLLGKMQLSRINIDELLRSAFSCTLCSRCEVECPINIDLKDLWISLRESLVKEGMAPEQLGLLKKRLERARNISFDTNEGRTDWIKAVPDMPADRFMGGSPEVIYFVGCVSSFSPRTFKIPRSAVQVFQKAGVDFGLLGDEEWCCGFPLLKSGFSDAFLQFAEHNIEKVNETAAKYLVTSCPSCYHMWSHTYPLNIKDIKMDFKVLHMVHYLCMLLSEGRISLNRLEKKVTYHDPCDLGRNSGIYEEPRKLLKAVPGLEFVELENSRECTTCCGGGGNVESVDPGLSSKIASKKAQEIISTGADTVVTSCQQCVRTITSALKKEGSKIRTIDITQLILESISWEGT